VKFGTLRNVVKWTGLVLVLICLFLITWFSLAKGPEMPFSFNDMDKFEHFLGYAGFSFSLTLMCIGFNKRFTGDNLTIKKLAKCSLVPILISLIYGVAIEFIQPHFGRAFELMDMVADFCGAIFGSLICLVCVVFVCKTVFQVAKDTNRQ
jgi:VanZ family protein